MQPLSAEATRKLGLDMVLDRLRDHLVGERSADGLRDFLQLDGLDAVTGALAATRQMQDCLSFEEPFFLGDIPDVEPILAQLGPSGVALEGADLLTLARLVRSFEALEAFFGERADSLPRLAAIFEGGDHPDLPWRHIESAIDEKGEVKDNASPELARIRRALASARAQARNAALDALKRATAAGYATEEQPTIRGGRLVIPVRAEAKRKIDGFVHDVSATGQTVYIEPAASLESNNRVRELELEDIRECHAIRVRLSEPFRTERPFLRRAVQALTRLDLERAKALLARDLDAVVPEVRQEGCILIQQARNPELSLVFRRDGSGREVIPFDLTMGGDHTMVVISGPNAGGKSVTMKAVGLMAAMVAMGLPIPVEEGSRFDLFDGVHLDIGDEQSMSDDLSTYTSHLRNISRILVAAGEDSLVLIDEAGTGTDPEAGGATAQAVLEALHARRVRTIVTTHYGPLKLFAHDTPGVLNASMSFDQEALRPTYGFQPGIPGSSYAREIAARSGIPDAIIRRAAQLVDSGQANAEALIQDLMHRNSRLEESLQEAEAMRASLQEREATLRAKLETIEEERDRIRSKAVAAAENIVREANRAVEKTIREIKESAADPERTREARQRLDRTRDKVEQAARKVERKQETRKQKERKTQAPPDASPGPVRVGDRVRMEDGEAVGEVLELMGRKARVAFGSIQATTSLDRLVRVGGKARQEVRVRQTGNAQLSVTAVSTRLDIRGMRVDEALSDIVPFIDRAMASGVSRVEVIHGKGTGALRSVLHDFLGTVGGVHHFEEAPISEGGAGVTHIHFA
ncbi:MAG: Smr/MutS family protein [Bacteroidetes bacterium]|nr:Smr/MutS family protein [Bacteroidota bacterium]